MYAHICVCECARERAHIFMCLCVCVHSGHLMVVTLMLTQANVFGILWINAPCKGLELELVLTQATVLAQQHMASHKGRSLFSGCKVHRDKSPGRKATWQLLLHPSSPATVSV